MGVISANARPGYGEGLAEFLIHAQVRPSDKRHIFQTVHQVPTARLSLINTLINAAIDLSDPDIFCGRDGIGRGAVNLSLVSERGKEKNMASTLDGG